VVFRGFLLLGGLAPGFDAVHGEQLGRVHRALAGARPIFDEALTQHRKRWWHAVEFKVVALAGRQRFAVPVGAIVGQPHEHCPVAVGQGRTISGLAVLKDERREIVGQIDDGQAFAARRFDIHHTLLTAHDLDRSVFGQKFARHFGQGILVRLGRLGCRYHGDRGRRARRGWGRQRRRRGLRKNRGFITAGKPAAHGHDKT
jgi:hypothetical protein